MHDAGTFECRIGTLNLTPALLPFDDQKESDPEVDPGPYHLFIVEVRGTIASLFVGSTRGHASLVRACSLCEENIKGGGCFFIDPQSRITLAGYSGSFGSIPISLAERFAVLVAESLRQRGIAIEGTKAEPVPEQLSHFWKKE
ncbi:MAG: hypothetical protein PHX87_06610 [Candidatus Peribacteraceae bacterium]|nr:hypothetical protein [Candidatus Peribacteraceae bacterium]MDD5743061.1 hypothetical protein [Candidatus Peribacteraceae bacterium]